MTDLEHRLRAVISEQKGLLDAITERCLNLAGEVAVLRLALAEKEKDVVPADPPANS